jgi:hypothetical protein
MTVSCQVDLHTDADAANDPTLITIHCVGAGHPGAISSGRRKVPISLHHHQQIHQVAGSDPYGQNQQAIIIQVHQVYRLSVWDPEQNHNQQQVPVYQRRLPGIL